MMKEMGEVVPDPGGVVTTGVQELHPDSQADRPRPGRPVSRRVGPGATAALVLEEDGGVVRAQAAHVWAPPARPASPHNTQPPPTSLTEAVACWVLHRR